MRIKTASVLPVVLLVFICIIYSCTKTVTNTKTVIVTDTVNTTTIIIDSEINLDKGLIAYYPFNGNTNDSGMNGLTGVVFGGVSYTNDVAGNANSAVTFDGSTGYIIVPDSTGKLQPDSITVSFFVKVANINSAQNFLTSTNFENGGGTSYGAGLNINNAGISQRFQFGTETNLRGCNIADLDPTNAVVAANVIVPNQWYHIVGIFTNGLQQIFINGVLNTAETRAFTILNKCPSNNLTIGAFWRGGLQPLNGSIDELRIYNRPLNQNEISKLAKPVH